MEEGGLQLAEHEADGVLGPDREMYPSSGSMIKLVCRGRGGELASRTRLRVLFVDIYNRRYRSVHKSSRPA